jgi:putative AdoMet-dependent methyltransferase
MINSSDAAILEIGGFTMRPIHPSDLKALAAIWTDPEVTRFLPSREVPIKREGVEKSLTSFIEHWKRGYGIWAIVENASSQMIGYCGLRYLDELSEVEVLYGLRKAYWGRGIATQAAKAAVSYGLNVAKLHRIIAMALPDNLASIRVIEKAGLQYEKQIHIFNLDALYYSTQPIISFPAWYFDESKMAGVDFEDAAQVEVYDRNQTASTNEKEQALVTRLGINAEHTVIDLGAGTGNFAIQASLTGASVHTVDISQAMLNYAKTKAQKAGATKIKFQKAGFLSYEHRDKLADFVVIKNALHILPDFWKMTTFVRIATMLKSKGVLYLRDVIFSFPPVEYEASINEWIRQVAKPEGEGWTARDFEMHVREEHSTFAWIIEGMLTRAGFEIVEANYNTPTYAEYLCIKTAC